MITYGKIVLTLYIVANIIGWIVIILKAIPTLISSIKCRKVKKCKKDDCPLRDFCFHTAFSDKEKEEMREHIRRLNE